MKIQRRKTHFKAHYWIFLVLVMVLIIPIINAPWTFDLNNDIKAFYKLNETSGTTALDSVIRSPLGEFNGSSSLLNLSVDGIIGTAYNFSNDNSNLSLPVGLWNSTTNNMTLSFWLYLDDNSSLTKVWEFVDRSDTNPQCVFRIENSTTMNMNCFSGAVIEFQFFFHTDSERNWTHYVLQISNDGNGNATLWRNGTVIASNSSTQINITDADFNEFGRGSREGASGSFLGRLDEIGWWDRYLDPDEIIDLFNDGVGITYEGTIIENSQTFNSTVYETETVSFSINVSTIDPSSTTGELFYNGTNEGNGTVVVSGGDSLTITNTVSIEELTTSPINRSFFWRISVAGDIFDSSTSSQRVAPAILGFCNATVSTPYINFTFRNETVDEEDVNATIVSTWFYWIDDQELNKTFSLSNSTGHSDYAFCFTPDNRTMNTRLNLAYNNDESQQRIFSPLLLTLTSTVTNQVLYLLPTIKGLFAQFVTQDNLGNVLSGVRARITRTLGASTITSVIDFTDSTGLVVMFLDPDITYTGTFSLTGFDDNSFSFIPTTDLKTVIMGGAVVTNQTGTLIGINTTWIITPTNGSLPNNTDILFGFNVTSGQSVSLISMNISNSSGTSLLFTSNAGAGFISGTNNTGNLSQIIGTFVIQTGNETITLSKLWTVGDEFVGDYSINRQLTLFLDYDFSEFIRLLIVIIVIIIIVIFMSAGEITDTSESKIAAVVILVWIFSFVGWLNNPAVTTQTGLAQFSRQYGIAILTTAAGSFFVLRRVFIRRI